MGGSERLARTSAERIEALARLTETVGAALDPKLDLEGRQQLEAFRFFLRLEAARGGFAEDDGQLAAEELGLFIDAVKARHPGARVVFWQGRGDPEADLGLGSVVRWDLVVRPPASSP